MPADPCWEVNGDFTVAGELRAGRTLLERQDRPTAIFAASDEMAIGVLRAAREAGLRVPEELSVIGIDDHEMASYFDLTTVAQPVHEQGRVAAAQVLGALRHPTGSRSRSSCRPTSSYGRPPHRRSDPAVGQVGDGPADGQTLALEPGHRSLVPPLDDPALEGRLGVEHLVICSA